MIVRRAAWLTLASTAAFLACGGNVVVDRSSGATTATTSVTTGTGTTSVTTGTTTTTTSSTSSSTVTTPVPACECAAVQAFLEGCGHGAPPTCESFAPLDCVCAALGGGCAGLDACLGGGTGGSSPGEPGLPLACRQCFVKAIQGPCAPELDACKQNPECQAELDCHKGCSYSAECNAQCDAAHPAGAADYATLILCGDCTECAPECAGTALFATYCVYGAK